MKVVILAGGFGTRLSEVTDLIPKPMVKIGNKPILMHIMQHYADAGYTDFIIALGYKSEVVKDYFLNYAALSSDFTVNLSSGEYIWLEKKKLNWNVTLIDTGLESMTGGRLLRLKKYIGNEPFMLTYGDGLSNVDIAKLVSFHGDSGAIVSVTTVRPSARFGELEIDPISSLVKSFKEKPQTAEGWINGGYFVIEPKFFDYLRDDSTILEREPLEELARQGGLAAYKHEGFWQCMDSMRDKKLLDDLWLSGNPPWKNTP
jgi:glucose-1-phosphate cytidylyltransferase